MLKFFNRVISIGFYALFFFSPLALAADTSELFEFNKMWLVFGLTSLILASWAAKMILEKKVSIQRTPLDIPIGLFLLSQLLSTIFSMDFHTSLWGYYSRFNGGFLSLLTYILLYYALVSNTNKKTYIRYLITGLLSGTVVALWGLPSHFGYDPTCLVFRGTLDVSCWTFAFQPKVRIFSTLGQPDWLAAYLVTLIPITLSGMLALSLKKNKIWSYLLLGATLLFMVDTYFTRARSGVVGLAFSLVVFFAFFFWNQRKSFTSNITLLFQRFKFAFVALLGMVLVTFIVGVGVVQIDNFLLPGIILKMSTPQQHTVATKPALQKAPTPTPEQSTGQEIGGGTDSGKIRLLVWKGALDVWLHNPIIGTGVETFAFAYYQYRPAAHNLTSEWDYLYNKAHNEYLNYLATTGALGLGTYLAFICLFLWILGRKLLTNDQIPNTKEAKTSSGNMSMVYGKSYTVYLLSLGLLSGFVSILVTNFFGFSVVVINLYLFLIPAFAFGILEMLDPKKQLLFPNQVTNEKFNTVSETSGFQWVGISIVYLIAIFFIITLIRFWNADRSYALGQNLDHVGDYQAAYQPLHNAVQTRPSEPVFQDELSINDAVLSSAIFQSDKTTAAKLAQEALQTSDTIVQNHPNVVTYWKTRVRVLYTLAQENPQLFSQALAAIQKAHELAPTDAKVSYNYGLVLGQAGQLDKAIQILEETIRLKPDYLDPYYALGIFYHTAALDKNGKVIHPDLQQKAIDQMHYILTHFDSTNKQAQDALKSWGAE